MQITIRQVINGYVVNHDGQEYIAATLNDAARLVGDYEPPHYVSYKHGFSVKDIVQVKQYMLEGRKIDAIKLLRACFVPMFSLREAKDIVDSLC